MTPNIAAALDELHYIQDELNNCKDVLGDREYPITEHDYRRCLLRAALLEMNVKTLQARIAAELTDTQLSLLYGTPPPPGISH